VGRLLPLHQKPCTVEGVVPLSKGFFMLEKIRQGEVIKAKAEKARRKQVKG
jgi:hypothetical protein